MALVENRLDSVTEPNNPPTWHPRPLVSVVVVNYRQWEQTGYLVEQLFSGRALREERAEIVIVDNHSPRHPQVGRLRRREGVSLRRWQRNRGFAAAVNEGCRLAVGDWLLLMNPDTTPSDGFLDELVQRIGDLERTQPRAGIVGFHLRNEDGSQQLSSGPFPTLLGTLARLCLPRRRRKYQKVNATELCEVPWVTGCCLLVRRACWEDLAGLDEDFFLYYEDVDLCQRARERNWSVWYEPALAVVHHHPLHGRPVPAALRLVLRHSLLTYAKRHWPAWQFRLLSRIVRLENGARRLGAWWRGDHHDGRIHRELDSLVDELVAGQTDAARQRLERVVHRKDLRVGV